MRTLHYNDIMAETATLYCFCIILNEAPCVHCLWGYRYCSSGRQSPDVWITTSAIAIATSLGLVVLVVSSSSKRLLLCQEHVPLHQHLHRVKQDINNLSVRVHKRVTSRIAIKGLVLWPHSQAHLKNNFQIGLGERLRLRSAFDDFLKVFLCSLYRARSGLFYDFAWILSRTQRSIVLQDKI